MPELPEVETIARALRPELVGRTILRADLRWARTLATPSVSKFRQQIEGQVIQAVGRRAKFLNFQLEAYNLLIHLRMSGDLRLKKGKIRPEKHDRLILTLSPRGRGQPLHLVFTDPRKFGRVWLTDDLDRILGALGPEPLEAAFTARWLYANLLARRRQLKPLLLDQSFIAGLGNIYTDEVLHRAKLHPQALSDSISEAQAADLHRAIRRVLNEGIRRNGATIDWVYRGGDFQNHFRVYGRTGRPCPVCGTTIQRLVIGQRSTHVCPNCQPIKRAS